jgi:hypothetical protein
MRDMAIIAFHNKGQLGLSQMECLGLMIGGVGQCMRLDVHSAEAATSAPFLSTSHAQRRSSPDH